VRIYSIAFEVSITVVLAGATAVANKLGSAFSAGWLLLSTDYMGGLWRIRPYVRVFQSSKEFDEWFAIAKDR
jgi:hypothetical protein